MAARFHENCAGQIIYAPRMGAAISAFGRNKTPNPHSASANACTDARSLVLLSAAAKAIVPASSHVTANSTSRQMMPTKTKAGGTSTKIGNSSAGQIESGASVNANIPKASQ